MASFVINTKTGVPDSTTDWIAHIVFEKNSHDPSVDEIISAINAATDGGISSLGDLLYKVNGTIDAKDPGTSLEVGKLAESYTTAPDPWDQNSVLPIKITHVMGTDFAKASFLLVKDGNEGSYVYDISGWNGTDEIDVYNVFYPKKPDASGTSHIEFFGSIGKVPPPNVVAVPEPSTVLAGMLLLLPFGVSTVKSLRRNRVE